MSQLSDDSVVVVVVVIRGTDCVCRLSVNLVRRRNLQVQVTKI